MMRRRQCLDEEALLSAEGMQAVNLAGVGGARSYGSELRKSDNEAGDRESG